MENDLNEGLFDDDYVAISQSDLVIGEIRDDESKKVLEKTLSKRHWLSDCELYNPKLIVKYTFLTLIVAGLVLLAIKLDLYNNIKLKSMVKKLSTISNIQLFEDSTVSFKVNEQTVNISLDDSKCKYYIMLDGDFVKSTSIDFLNYSSYNELKATPNSAGNLLLYSVDNYNGSNEIGKELVGDKTRIRYSEISEGYLLEIHFSKLTKANIVYFNSKGEVSEEPISNTYLVNSKEGSQVVIPKDYEVEKVVANIISYLDNR